MRDCSDSLANVQELLRSCTTPSTCRLWTSFFFNCFFNCFCWIYWSYKNQNVGYRSESHKDACISLNMDQVVDGSDNGLSAAHLPSQCQFDWCYCLYYLSACLEQLMAEIYWSFTEKLFRGPDCRDGSVLWFHIGRRISSGRAPWPLDLSYVLMEWINGYCCWMLC